MTPLVAPVGWPNRPAVGEIVSVEPVQTAASLIAPDCPVLVLHTSEEVVPSASVKVGVASEPAGVVGFRHAMVELGAKVKPEGSVVDTCAPVYSTGSELLYQARTSTVALGATVGLADQVVPLSVEYSSVLVVAACAEAAANSGAPASPKSIAAAAIRRGPDPAGEIGRAHRLNPVPNLSSIPSFACKKK